MNRYHIPTLKVLVLVFSLLQSKTTHAQELAFLNKFYFPISDTTKFQPKFCQQSLDKEGNIANPEIMNPEEVFPSLAKEVLRVVKSYPHKWLPGEKDGQPVSTFLSLPVSFNVP